MSRWDCGQDLWLKEKSDYRRDGDLPSNDECGQHIEWETRSRWMLGRYRYQTAKLSGRTAISTVWAFDWHRGGGHPPTPATPPCVRVRTRRFELVTLTPSSNVGSPSDLK